MPRFFCTDIDDSYIHITGDDAHHISRVLRLRKGDPLVVCDGNGTDYSAAILDISPQEIRLAITGAAPTLSEPGLKVTLYQGMPKGDKMDWIIQKTVELGVSHIVPVITERSIARPDSAKAAKKQERWQKIAAEAAGQSGRGVIPVVEAPVSWKQMCDRVSPEETVVFYEGGGAPLSSLVGRDKTELAVIIGPEGGFSAEEITALTEMGVKTATLGPRILRCETAPLAALSIIMSLSGNME